jgi:hypothetical protein
MLNRAAWSNESNFIETPDSASCISQTSAMHNENQYETLQAKISFRRVSEQRKAGVS